MPYVHSVGGDNYKFVINRELANLSNYLLVEVVDGSTGEHLNCCHIKNYDCLEKVYVAKKFFKKNNQLVAKRYILIAKYRLGFDILVFVDSDPGRPCAFLYDTKIKGQAFYVSNVVDSNYTDYKKWIEGKGLASLSWESVGDSPLSVDKDGKFILLQRKPCWKDGWAYDTYLVVLDSWERSQPMMLIFISNGWSLNQLQQMASPGFSVLPIVPQLPSPTMYVDPMATQNNPLTFPFPGY